MLRPPRRTYLSVSWWRRHERNEWHRGVYRGKMKFVMLAISLLSLLLARRVGKRVYFGVFWKLYNSVGTLVIV